MARKLARMAMAAVCAVAGTGVAWAADAPSTIDVITLRQAGQALVGGDFVGMLQAAKNKLPDVKPFTKGALALAGWEKQFVLMFPPGSERGHDTKALPAIWTNRAGFEEHARKLATEAGKLAQLAKAGDQPGFAAQVKVVGDACTACHKEFRAK